MRTASYRVSDLQKFVIPIGFVGENEHCQIIFLAEDAYAEYPNAAASLTVRPPYGEPYPAVVTRDGNNVVWTVKDSDLTRSGQGEIQLSFTTGEIVAKTYVGKTKVCRSLQPTGDVPDPLEDFLTEAGAALTAIPETIAHEFEAIQAVAQTLEPGSQATAHFDGETKQLEIGVPEGEKGDPGYTPRRGVDYWTEADQAAMRQDIADDTTAARQAIAQDKAAAELAITQDKNAAQQAISEDRAAAITAIGNKGTEQVCAVANKGAEVLASIPSDYTELSEDVSGLKIALNSVGVIQKGQFDDGDILFSSENIKEGDIVYYSFDARNNYSGYIDILNTSGSRITYIGKGAASGTVNHYEGSYTIPANFGKAIVTARASSTALTYITVNYAISNNLVKYMYDTLQGLPQIDDTAGEGATNKLWSADKSADENAKLLNELRVIGVIQKGQADNNATLFSSNNVKEGDTLYYNFDASNGYSGYIDILNTSGSRITYIGKGSSTLTENHYEGSYTIPANFGKAVVVAIAGSSTKYITINYAVTNNLLKYIVGTLQTLPQIDDTAGEGATNKLWSANKSATENAELSNAIRNIGIIQKGQADDGTVLVSSNDVNEGDILYYSFDARANYCGYIDILNTSGSRITYIGKGTSSGPGERYEGSYTIPANFGKAIVVARIGSGTSYLSYITVNYATTNSLIYKIIQDTEQQETAAQKRINIDYKCTTHNRLANPAYTTFDAVNESGTVITRDVPLNKSTESVNGSYRIPTCIITNAGSVLVAAERRDNGTSSDKGVISIDIVRKAANGNWGTVTTILPYNSTYGRYMDPCFVIDRTGTHGVTGRIYLFAGTFLNDDAFWSGNTYEESNMVYIYSDDDGVTWSNQVSVKSAWEATETCVLPAPCNGIQLTNGTLVIPVFGHDGTRNNNALFYKTPNGNWTMSAKNELVSYNINENTIVEYDTNKVKIYCNNNTAFPRTQYPDQFDRYCTPTFTYDFTTNSFTQVESTFDRNLVCQFSVEKVDSIYLMSFPDVNSGHRENITVWASNDGEVWIRCFKAYMTTSNGYSVVSYYDDKIILVFEDHQGSISFENLTPITELFNESCEKYIDNVSVQDRLQMLSDK